MSYASRVVTGLLGYCWAQCVIVIGLALLLAEITAKPETEAGLTMIAGGAVLAMGLVVDKLVPDAGRTFVWTLKGAAIVMFIACGAWTLQGIITGRVDLL
ncbi:MAG: hypothetical protein AAGC44_12005 [Planctomycetota bacterium]